MRTKKNFRSLIVSLLGIVSFVAISAYLSSCGVVTNCQAVGLSCSKTPYEYKACADGSGAYWWELNGTKYYDVTAATNAYMAYCE